MEYCHIVSLTWWILVCDVELGLDMQDFQLCLFSINAWIVKNGLPSLPYMQISAGLGLILGRLSAPAATQGVISSAASPSFLVQRAVRAVSVRELGLHLSLCLLLVTS